MALYSRIHVWVTNEILTASDLNNEFNNILNNANAAQLVGYSATVSQMQQTADPGGVGTESLAGSTSDEIQRLRFTIKRIAGQSQWYVAPVGSLSTGGIVTANYAAGSVDNAALAANAVDTANIVDGSVTPAKFSQNSSLSPSSNNFTSISTTPVDVTNLSVSFTTSGRRIMLVLVATPGSFDSYVGSQGNIGASDTRSLFQFVRDTTTIGRCEIANFSAPANPVMRAAPGCIVCTDDAAAGTYTYKVQVYAQTGNTAIVNYCNLLIYEL